MNQLVPAQLLRARLDQGIAEYHARLKETFGPHLAQQIVVIGREVREQIERDVYAGAISPACLLAQIQYRQRGVADWWTIPAPVPVPRTLGLEGYLEMLSTQYPRFDWRVQPLHSPDTVAERAVDRFLDLDRQQRSVHPLELLEWVALLKRSSEFTEFGPDLYVV